MKHQPRPHPVRTALLRLLVLLPIGAGMMSLASLLCWYAAEVLFSDTSSWQRAYRLYDNPVSSIILPCVFSVAALVVAVMTASRRRTIAVLIGFAWGIPVLPVAGFTIIGGILLWPLVYAYPIFGLAQALLVLNFRMYVIDLFSRGLAVPHTLK
jgi:hypothetical protein